MPYVIFKAYTVQEDVIIDSLMPLQLFFEEAMPLQLNKWELGTEFVPQEYISC
jgi:hypothetical protein